MFKSLCIVVLLMHKINICMWRLGGNLKHMFRLCIRMEGLWAYICLFPSLGRRKTILTGLHVFIKHYMAISISQLTWSPPEGHLLMTTSHLEEPHVSGTPDITVSLSSRRRDLQPMPRLPVALEDDKEVIISPTPLPKHSEDFLWARHRALTTLNHWNLTSN